MTPRRLAALGLVLAVVLLAAVCAPRRGEDTPPQPELLLRYAENQPADYPTTQDRKSVV